MNTEYKIKRAMLAVLPAMMAVGMLSCNDDNEPAGEPFFYIGGVEQAMTIRMNAGGTVNAADANGMSDFSSGIQYDVEARGDWYLESVDPVDPDWVRLHPMSGSDEGIIKAYANINTDIKKRSAKFRIVLNGVEQPELLTLIQDAAPAQFTFSSDKVTLKTEGGSSTLTVTSNVGWELKYDTDLDWLTVDRNDNLVTFTALGRNDTGAHRSTTVYVCGTGDYTDAVYPIVVTQLSVLYSEDFGWLYCTTFPPTCWSTPDNSKRIDFWPTFFKDKVDNPDLLTAWTAVDDASAAAPTFAHFNYVKLGGTARAGNICSPAIRSIEGEVNVIVSWSMAGNCTAKNVRSDCNDFTVALLGPGRITEAIAYGHSTGSVATGEFTIPYNSEGKTSTCDIYLSEIATFAIGVDGYFTTADPTGLEVWNSPDSQFAIKVQGMTSETRIVFIGSEADKVTMLNNWTTSNGNHSDARKCFDNFRIEID